MYSIFLMFCKNSTADESNEFKPAKHSSYASLAAFWELLKGNENLVHATPSLSTVFTFSTPRNSGTK